jgi:putative intracellular protease/amidase
VFATPDGRAGACDPVALEGVVFGQIGAKPADAQLYREMERDAAFQHPIAYHDIEVEAFDALHLPGGHAPGMRPYLESEILQAKVVEFFAHDKLVSAICHGPIVLARAKDPVTGRSLLHGRRSTALTKMLERSGWLLTMWTLGRRFRTYPTYVQDEVVAAIGDASKFDSGPLVPSYRNPFTVRDGNLITARWPGDAHRLADELTDLLVSSTHERAADSP